MSDRHSCEELCVMYNERNIKIEWMENVKDVFMEEPLHALTIDAGLPQYLVDQIVSERTVRGETKEKSSFDLVGTPGYKSPQPELWHDAVVIIANEKNLLLKGPTGSGKTKLAETLSYLWKQPMFAVNCSVDLDAEALLGHKTIVQKDGYTVIEFVPGPVVQAMREGALLYIDEINMAKPETLPILNSVLDYRRTLTNPFTGEVEIASPGFRVIAAMNEGYIGTVPLNEALKNRFVVLETPYLQGQALKQLLQVRSDQSDETTLDRFVQLSADLMVQAEMGQIPDEAVSIRALLDACDLSLHMPPLRAIERAIAAKLEEERERAAVRNIADTLF